MQHMLDSAALRETHRDEMKHSSLQVTSRRLAAETSVIYPFLF